MADLNEAQKTVVKAALKTRFEAKEKRLQVMTDAPLTGKEYKYVAKAYNDEVRDLEADISAMQEAAIILELF